MCVGSLDTFNTGHPATNIFLDSRQTFSFLFPIILYTRSFIFSITVLISYLRPNIGSSCGSCGSCGSLKGFESAAAKIFNALDRKDQQITKLKSSTLIKTMDLASNSIEYLSSAGFSKTATWCPRYPCSNLGDNYLSRSFTSWTQIPRHAASCLKMFIARIVIALKHALLKTWLKLRHNWPVLEVNIRT